MKRPRTAQWSLSFRQVDTPQSTVRRHYEQYRASQGVPQRCDNEACMFHREPLVWNGKELRLTLDHINGVSRDNRPENLRFLCPNCEAQLSTRGGKNKGRVQYWDGGFFYTHRDGRRDALVQAVTPTATASVPLPKPPGKRLKSK